MGNQPSLWEELATYFEEKYFSPDLSQIQNYDSTDVQRFLPFLIVGLCVGTFLAICFSYYHNHYLGKVVRKLYKEEAFSKENAKTLDEIGCNKFFIRRNLAKDSVLAKYVKPADEIKNQKEAKEAKFYIVEEDKYIADKRFKESKHGKLFIVLSFILCTAACFILLYIVPDVLQLADNAYTMITKPKGK